jgi:intracellular multiplication protein IcmE
MIVAGALIAAASVFFSGGKQPEQMSKLVNPPDIHRASGGTASPYFIQQTKEAEAQRTKEALEKGTSALPTPIGNPNDINVTEKTDPMNELRGETERLKQQLAELQNAEVVQKAQAQRQAQQQLATQAAAPHQQAAEQFDASLSQAMQAQLKQLMDSWTPKPGKQVDVSKEGAGGAGSGANGKPAETQQVADASGAFHKADEKPIVTAGTVSYAQLLTEANSDVPTPILAQIVSGPLAGARAIGSFQVANGYNDYLVLRFHLADKKGVDYRIDAIALDPDTTLGGMATEVDQRYFTRVILPAAAGFLQGFGQALGQTSSSVTTNGTTTIVSQAGPGITQGVAQGAASAASTAASFFQSQANLTKPLVVVAAGTPMGLFFVSSVYDPSSAAQQAAANGCPPGSSPNYTGRAVNGAPPNGCTPTIGTAGGGLSAAGYQVQQGGGQNGFNGGSSGFSDVPYPNYGNAGSQSRTYGSPYSPLGASSTYGNPSNYYGR